MVFEFEIYLPKHLEEEPTYREEEVNDLDHITKDFYQELMSIFSERSNRNAYANLTDEFSDWQTERIDHDIDQRMKDAGESYEDEDEYEEKKMEYQDEMADEDDYSFDAFVDSEFAGSLASLISHYRFNDTTYGYGVTEDGYIIIEPEYEDENESFEEWHHENLKEFLKDRLDSPVSTSSYNKDYDTTWYIAEDGSLSRREPDDDYFAVEVISRKYPASQWRKLFLSTLSLFEEYGEDSLSGRPPRTNSNTGLHFGVSFDDGRKVNMLKLVILGQDSFWVKKVNREFNQYCSSQVKHLLEKLQNISKSDMVTAKVNELKGESIDKAADYIIDELDRPIKHEKYTSINFTKEDYIEFRLAGNDYYNKFRKNNMEIIEWFIYILVAAASNTLWEREYKQWLVSKFDLFVMKNPRREDEDDYDEE